MSEITIFKFHGFFEGDTEDHCNRYFAAKTSEEAWEKLEAYQEKQVADGFLKFIPCGEPEVELDGVMI